MDDAIYVWAIKALRISADLSRLTNSPEVLAKAYDSDLREAKALADRLETEVRAIILATRMGA